MKNLVDSCIWIEWLCDSSFSKKFEKPFKNIENFVVPTIIQFELYKWICREKSEEVALKVIALTKSAHVIELNTSISLLAAEYASQYKLAMADAIVYATAKEFNVPLLTCDSHFRELPDVEFYPKATVEV